MAKTKPILFPFGLSLAEANLIIEVFEWASLNDLFDEPGYEIEDRRKWKMNEKLWNKMEPRLIKFANGERFLETEATANLEAQLAKERRQYQHSLNAYRKRINALRELQKDLPEPFRSKICNILEKGE